MVSNNIACFSRKPGFFNNPMLILHHDFTLQLQAKKGYKI